MRPRSKFNEPERERAAYLLIQDLKRDVKNGADLIKTARSLIRNYIDAGYDIDDDIFSDIIGIDSETDDIDIQSRDSISDSDRAFSIYKKPFDEARDRIYSCITDN